MAHQPISPELNRITGEIVDACIQVHRALGPGLLEGVYEACLVAELRHRGLHVEQQVGVPIVYRNVCLPKALRLDLLVEGVVILELKAVEIMHPLYEAQLLSYLRLSQRRLGLLINFNVPLMKDGIKRIVNPDPL